MRWSRLVYLVLICQFGAAVAGAAEGRQRLSGTVVDATSGAPLAARVYLRAADGTWLFPRSAAADGSAVEYRKDRQAGSVEMHTTLSAHPFTIDLAPGDAIVFYTDGLEALLLQRATHDPLDSICDTRWFRRLADRSLLASINDIVDRLEATDPKTWPVDDVSVVALSVK